MEYSQNATLIFISAYFIYVFLGKITIPLSTHLYQQRYLFWLRRKDLNLPPERWKAGVKHTLPAKFEPQAHKSRCYKRIPFPHHRAWHPSASVWPRPLARHRRPRYCVRRWTFSVSFQKRQRGWGEGIKTSSQLCMLQKRHSPRRENVFFIRTYFVKLSSLRLSMSEW